MEFNNKNTAIISIIIILLSVAAVCAYYFFIYDDSIQYNLSDVSFKAHQESMVLNLSSSIKGFSYYNGNATTVKVAKFNEMNSLYALGIDKAFDTIKDYPSETFNERVMYKTTANVGENIGDPRYITFVKDNSRDIEVSISTDSMEETDFIANSIEIL